jgi:hypothetical protein
MQDISDLTLSVYRISVIGRSGNADSPLRTCPQLCGELTILDKDPPGAPIGIETEAEVAHFIRKQPFTEQHRSQLG